LKYDKRVLVNSYPGLIVLLVHVTLICMFDSMCQEFETVVHFYS